MHDGLKEIYVSNESLFGKFLFSDVKNGDDTFIGTELNETIIQI